eukprot:scaffold248651_cov45-Attheya_sp.AAC.1
MMYDDEYADHDDDDMGLTRTLDEHEEDEEECSDDEEEDDEDGLANLLMDKSFWKQHAVAIVIALVGSILGHSYTSSSLSLSSSVPIPYPSPSSYLMQAPTRNLESDSDSTSTSTITTQSSFFHPHLESYRRTDGLMFCPRRFMGDDHEHEETDSDESAYSLLK